MSITANTIVKNTANYALALIGRKFLTVIYFVLIARYTGVHTTGLYYLLISVATIFTPLMDFGLAPTLIREGSKEPEHLSRYLNNILGLKFILCLLASTLGFLLITVLDYPLITKQLVYMVIVLMVLESFGDSFYACLRACHKFQYEARGLVIGQTITLVVGGIAVWQQKSIYYLILALILNQLFNFLYALRQVISQLGIIPKLHFDTATLKSFGFMAIPFLIAVAFERILAVDTLLLSFMADEEAIGWFSIPSTIINNYQFIPISITAAAYPALSNFFITSESKFIKTFETSYFTILVLALPAAIGLAALSPEIIQFVFGVSYEPSILPLQILSFSLIPISLYYPLRTLLDAANKQMTNTILLCISATLHLALSILLIPQYKAVGIALSTLSSHMLLFLTSLFWVPKILTPYRLQYLLVFLKTALASTLMGLFVFFLKRHLHVLIVIPLGAVFYIGIFYLIEKWAPQILNKNKIGGLWFELAKQFLSRPKTL